MPTPSRPPAEIPDADRVSEAVRRGRLYRDAGADRIYPIAVGDRSVLATLVGERPGPINGNTSDQLDLAVLRELGVARVSCGSRCYWAALAELKKSVQAPVA